MNHKGDTGLSLIELIVTLAIFALVAVMGSQALTGMLRNRDALEAHTAQNAELARAIALLRADLSSTVPMAFFPPNHQPNQPAIHMGQDRLSLSISGRASLELDSQTGAGFQRVTWQLRDELLVRQIWNSLTPANQSALRREQVIMSRVSALSMRHFDPDLGWRRGLPRDDRGTLFQDTEASLPRAYSALPQSIELTLTIDGFGPVILVESF